MLDFFNSLGMSVEKRWRDVNYDETVFPRIATEALVEVDSAGRVTPEDVISWLASASALPRQHDLPANFGDPPLTLYNGSRFYIDIYFWKDGRTAIHQHQFSGAFQVLKGWSLHDIFRFDIETRVNDRLLLGCLSSRKLELLRQGDIRAITRGSSFIHSVFHLSQPCVSLVIRTMGESVGPQYKYFPPGLALDPFFQEPCSIRQQQLLNYLIATEYPEKSTVARDLVRQSDFLTCFQILNSVSSYCLSHRSGNVLAQAQMAQRLEFWDGLLSEARTRHGDLCDILVPVFREEERIRQLSGVRARVQSEEHRTFLGMLLCVREREPLLELVSQRYPGPSPVERILDWMEELMETRTEISGDGVLEEKWNDQMMLALEHLLRGNSGTGLQEEFASMFPDEDPLQAIERVINSKLFAGLLADQSEA